MGRQKKAILLALLAVFFWSTVAVPFKFGLKYFHFVHFLFIAITIAAIVLLTNVIVQNKIKLLKQLKPKDLFIGIAGGFLNPFLYYLMLFKAYSLLPAQIAQALNYTWPIMLVILSVPLLGQKFKLVSLLTLLLGFVGVYLIASEGHPWPLAPTQPLGIVLAVSTSVIWALFWILNTRSKVDVTISLLLNFTSAWLMTLPLLYFVPFNYNVPALAWSAVVYTGIFEMGLTFVIWLAAMKTTQRTDQISNFVFLSPFLSLFFIYFILGENIFSTTIIGLAIIILSVLTKQYFEVKLKRK